MKTFTINDTNEIVAFATPEEAAASTATPFDSFASEQELAELASAWPGGRMVEIWNSLPGVTPVKKFKDNKTAIHRIWARIQNLGGSAESEAQQPKEPTAAQKAKGGARAAKGTPAKAKSSKKATPAKGAPKAKKTAKGESSAGREGSKTAQVVAMLQRKNGATLTEIMEKFGWQAHTVRGFMAGAMKKAGHTVESFKPEGGERTYRIAK
jgi:Protein of unknown function (DUF3489)